MGTAPLRGPLTAPICMSSSRPGRIFERDVRTNDVWVAHFRVKLTWSIVVSKASLHGRGLPLHIGKQSTRASRIGASQPTEEEIQATSSLNVFLGIFAGALTNM